MEDKKLNKRELDALEIMSKVSKEDAMRPFVFGYFQGLEAGILLAAKENKKTA